MYQFDCKFPAPGEVAKFVQISRSRSSDTQICMYSICMNFTSETTTLVNGMVVLYSLTTKRLQRTVGATPTWSRFRCRHCRLPHRPTKWGPPRASDHRLRGWPMGPSRTGSARRVSPRVTTRNRFSVGVASKFWICTGFVQICMQIYGFACKYRHANIPLGAYKYTPGPKTHVTPSFALRPILPKKHNDIKHMF